jgi:CHAP domain
MNKVGIDSPQVREVMKLVAQQIGAGGTLLNDLVRVDALAQMAMSSPASSIFANAVERLSKASVAMGRAADDHDRAQQRRPSLAKPSTFRPAGPTSVERELRPIAQAAGAAGFDVRESRTIESLQPRSERPNGSNGHGVDDEQTASDGDGPNELDVPNELAFTGMRLSVTTKKTAKTKTKNTVSPKKKKSVPSTTKKPEEQKPKTVAVAHINPKAPPVAVTGNAQIDRVLAEANSERGLQETTGRTNETKYPTEAGKNHPKADEWCATFVVAMLKRAGVVMPKGTDTAGTTSMLDAAKKNNLDIPVSEVRPGDVVYRLREGGGHVGIVVKVEGDKIWVIAGNTSSETGEKGTLYVAEKQDNNWSRAWRPPYTDAPAPSTTTPAPTTAPTTVPVPASTPSSPSTKPKATSAPTTTPGTVPTTVPTTVPAAPGKPGPVQAGKGPVTVVSASDVAMVPAPPATAVLSTTSTTVPSTTSTSAPASPSTQPATGGESPASPPISTIVIVNNP